MPQRPGSPGPDVVPDAPVKIRPGSAQRPTRQDGLRRAGPGRPKASISDVATFFDGSRLTLARHLAGLRSNALADLVDKTPTTKCCYESGRDRPAAATVAQLALALGVEPLALCCTPSGPTSE